MAEDFKSLAYSMTASSVVDEVSTQLYMLIIGMQKSTAADINNNCIGLMIPKSYLVYRSRGPWASMNLNMDYHLETGSLCLKITD